MSQLFLPTQLASVLRFNDSCSPTAFKCLLTFLCPSSPGREEDALVFKVRKGGLGEGKRPAPDTLRGVAVGPQVQRSCVCCSITWGASLRWAARMGVRGVVRLR